MDQNSDLLLDSKSIRGAIMDQLQKNALGLYNACQAREGLTVTRGTYYRLRDWLYPDKAKGDYARPTHQDVIILCEILGITFKIQVDIGDLPDEAKAVIDPRYKEEVDKVNNKINQHRQITNQYTATEDE